MRRMMLVLFVGLLAGPATAGAQNPYESTFCSITDIRPVDGGRAQDVTVRCWYDWTCPFGYCDRVGCPDAPQAGWIEYRHGEGGAWQRAGSDLDVWTEGSCHAFRITIEGERTMRLPCEGTDVRDFVPMSFRLWDPAAGRYVWERAGQDGPDAPPQRPCKNRRGKVLDANLACWSRPWLVTDYDENPTGIVRTHRLRLSGPRTVYVQPECGQGSYLPAVGRGGRGSFPQTLIGCGNSEGSVAGIQDRRTDPGRGGDRDRPPRPGATSSRTPLWPWALAQDEGRGRGRASGWHGL